MSKNTEAKTELDLPVQEDNSLLTPASETFAEDQPAHTPGTDPQFSVSSDNAGPSELVNATAANPSLSSSASLFPGSLESVGTEAIEPQTSTISVDTLSLGEWSLDALDRLIETAQRIRDEKVTRERRAFVAMAQDAVTRLGVQATDIFGKSGSGRTNTRPRNKTAPSVKGQRRAITSAVTRKRATAGAKSDKPLHIPIGAKFRSPEGEVWTNSGRGRRPSFIIQAAREGILEDYRVK